jgi:hypothetical protein
MPQQTGAQLTYCTGCRLFHRPPLHTERNKHGYQHPEAFCLMTYASKDYKIVELIWNSRDGVTPFMVPPREVAGPITFDNMLQHTDWHRDIRLLEYRPVPGERYFVDLTPERKRQFLSERVSKNWNTGNSPFSANFATPEDAVEALFEEEFRPGEPDLVEMNPPISPDDDRKPLATCPAAQKARRRKR